MTVRLPPALHAKLHEEAYRRHWSMNEVIIEAVEKELASEAEKENQRS